MIFRAAWNSLDYNKPVSSEILTVSSCQTLHASYSFKRSAGHRRVHTDSPQRRQHLEFSGLFALWSAPELSMWKSSHTIKKNTEESTLHDTSLSVSCGVVRLRYERSCDTLLILRLSVPHVHDTPERIICFVLFFHFKTMLIKMVAMFSSQKLPLCLLELLSLFYRLKGEL